MHPENFEPISVDAFINLFYNFLSLSFFLDKTFLHQNYICEICKSQVKHFFKKNTKIRPKKTPLLKTALPIKSC